MAIRKNKTSPPEGETPAQPGDVLGGEDTLDLRRALNTRLKLSVFGFWVVGDSPLITHAWSQKAKTEMLQKQVKAVKGKGREARDPNKDFVDSMYPMPGGKQYGFPVTGVKEALMSAAHKDKGIAKSVTMSSLWLNPEWVTVKTAYPGSVCTLPLIRVYGGKPVMREDMVRIGSGLKKTASLAYRAEFWPWAIYVSGRVNSTQLSADALRFLIDSSGMEIGLGEWRNERKGLHGSFHFGTEEEEAAWTAYRVGEGPLPDPGSLAIAAQ